MGGAGEVRVPGPSGSTGSSPLAIWKNLPAARKNPEGNWQEDQTRRACVREKALMPSSPPCPEVATYEGWGMWGLERQEGGVQVLGGGRKGRTRAPGSGFEEDGCVS